MTPLRPPSTTRPSSGDRKDDAAQEHPSAG